MPNHINTNIFSTKYGELFIGSFNSKLCICDWQFRKMRKDIDQRICKYLDAVYFNNEDEIIKQTKSELNEYFSGLRKQFEVPLLFAGSNFQISVWNELLKIPYGTTTSYLSLAKSVKNEKAVRAIAAANGANAISIIVPCHRVIGANNELVGYAGGLEAKKNLLILESSYSQSVLF